MKFPAIFYLLGRLFCIIGVSMFIPALTSMYYKETGSWQAFLISAFITLALGASLIIYHRKAKEQPIAIRDGFLLVTLSWLCPFQ